MVTGPDRDGGEAVEALGGAHTASAPGDSGGVDELGRPAAVQMGLFGGEVPSETGRNLAERREGPGRPLGAVNRTKAGIREWLMALGYTHPAIRLAELAEADTKALARLLGCKAIDILAEQRKAAEGLMPYFESRKPIAVELPPGDERPVIIIGDAGDGASARRQRGVFGLDDPVEDIVQDQGVSGDASVRPGEEGSHDEAQAIDPLDDTGE